MGMKFSIKCENENEMRIMKELCEKYKAVIVMICGLYLELVTTANIANAMVFELENRIK